MIVESDGVMIQPFPHSRWSFTVPPDAHSLAGFRAWAASDGFPEQVRISLIQGELLIDMNPERIETHNWVKTEVLRVLATLARDSDLGQVCTDGAWITNDKAELSTEPDAAFISWQGLESGRVEIVPTAEDGIDGIEIRGSPDWMLEVVSPSSVRKDTRLVPTAYHRAGVREFWLVDARGAEVEFTVFVWREAGFIASVPQDGWSDSPVFGRQFRLTRERSRRGGWRYTLDVR
jgi:Uma2 family endonuclease